MFTVIIFLFNCIYCIKYLGESLEHSSLRFRSIIILILKLNLLKRLTKRNVGHNVDKAENSKNENKSLNCIVGIKEVDNPETIFVKYVL